MRSWPALGAVVSTTLAELLTLILLIERGGRPPVAMTISHLGERGATEAWLFDIALALFAAAILLVASELRSTHESRLPVLALQGSGVLIGAAAVVVLDPLSLTQTWAHRVLAGGGLFTLSCAALVLPPALRRRGYREGLALVSMGIGVATIALEAAILALYLNHASVGPVEWVLVAVLVGSVQAVAIWLTVA